MVQMNFYPLGRTAPATELPELVGGVHTFQHVDYSLPESQRTIISNQEIIAIWVKNDSGGTLSASQIVTWKSGSAGTLIGGVTADAATGCGAVDPFLTTTVANGEFFYIIVRGPGRGISAGSVSANAIIIPAASGRFNTVTNDAAGSLNACGRLNVASTAAAQVRDVIWAFPGY
jgi:hypothetical protein